MLQLVRTLIFRSKPFDTTVLEWFDHIRHQRKGHEVEAQVRRDLIKRWNARPLTSIKPQDITAVVTEVARTKGPSSAAHLYSYCTRFFRWCVQRGYLDRAPTEGLSLKALIGPLTGRERVLSLDELRTIWLACDPWFDHDRIVQLLMLTGARRTEIGGLHWREISLQDRLISLPKERSKNGRPHLIPLSQTAFDLLPKPRVRAGHVFGRKSSKAGFVGWSRGKAALDRRTGPMQPWVLHDLRRACVTHWNELGLAPPWVIEATVNHVSGHKAGVAGIYNKALYLPERRALMDTWATELTRLVG